jgi:hypothetical protein
MKPMQNLKAFAAFREIYIEELTKRIKAKPAEYGYNVVDVPGIVDKMISALDLGTANKDSPSIRATCKRLSIPYTLKDIQSYLCGVAA